MFCPNCGVEITNGESNFCFKCGYNFQNGMPNNSARIVSKLYTTEPPRVEMNPNATIVVNKAKSIAAAGQPWPIKVEDPKFKAKCEYCSFVFTYFQSNLGFRAWYQHGFVYCPSCRKPLRHSPDLMVQNFNVSVNADGTFSAQ